MPFIEARTQLSAIGVRPAFFDGCVMDGKTQRALIAATVLSENADIVQRIEATGVLKMRDGVDLFRHAITNGYLIPWNESREIDELPPCSLTESLDDKEIQVVMHRQLRLKFPGIGEEIYRQMISPDGLSLTSDIAQRIFELKSSVANMTFDLLHGAGVESTPTMELITKLFFFDTSGDDKGRGTIVGGGDPPINDRDGGIQE